jgi:putative ABC transport system ATP-binding protein
MDLVRTMGPVGMSECLIRTVDLCRTYMLGTRLVHALRGVAIEIHPGEFVAVMGPSGSGKSSLMNVIGMLDRATSGSYWFDGLDVSQLDHGPCAQLRSKRIGFVFQNFNLLGRNTALENVELPLIYAGVKRHERLRCAKWALEKVGLAERVHHWPSQLSGGEQQRVAIARALVNNPSLILADEPTGALDSITGLEIMKQLSALNDEGRTVILVTHDHDVAHHARRIIAMRDGRVVEDQVLVKASTRAVTLASPVHLWSDNAQRKSGVRP